MKKNWAVIYYKKKKDENNHIKNGPSLKKQRRLKFREMKIILNIYAKMTEKEKNKLKLNKDPDYKRYLRLMKDTKHKY